MQERALQHENLSRQQHEWHNHATQIVTETHHALALARGEYEAEVQAEELRDCIEQLQSDLNAWAEWYQVDQTEQEEAAASAPVDLQPATLRTQLSGPPGPCTPPIVQPHLAQEFLPPSSLPLFMEPPRRQVQPQQPAASQVQPQTPSGALPVMPSFSGAPQAPEVGRASTVAPLTPALGCFTGTG